MHDSSLAPVVQKLDNAIQGINHYLVHSAIGSPNTYPLDSDLGPVDSDCRLLWSPTTIWLF